MGLWLVCECGLFAGQPPAIGFSEPDAIDDGAPYAQALHLLERSQFQAALEKCDEALQEEWPPRFANRIQATAARCLLRLNERAAALRRLEAIYQRNSASTYLSLLPLVWDENLPASERILVDVRDLQSGSVPSNLVAASAWLHDAEHRDVCVSLLKQIRDSGPLPMNLMAETQLWRLQVMDGHVAAESTVRRWQERMADLPESVQAGPHFVTGRALQARQRPDAAAVEFLWAPCMQQHDACLAALSLREAAACLKLAGRARMGRRLLAELQQRFPETSSARSTQSAPF